MFTINIEVEIEFENGQEDTVDVEIDIENFEECEDKSDKIDYIEQMTRTQHEDVKEVNFTEDDLKEVQEMIDDINDTSELHPNEDFDDFMEHEDFD